MDGLPTSTKEISMIAKIRRHIGWAGGSLAQHEQSGLHR
jgi:hypothetical protein